MTESVDVFFGVVSISMYLRPFCVGDGRQVSRIQRHTTQISKYCETMKCEPKTKG